MTQSTQTPASGAASRLKSLALGVLVICNIVLALSLSGRFTTNNTAHAGSSLQGRVSDYMIIPSRPLGLNQDVLYVLDTDNGRLSVVGYDATNNQMEFVPPLDLRRGR